MKAVCAWSALCVVFGFAASAWAEPYSPACEGAIERISKARKALVPFRRTLEMARAYEYGAYGEATTCLDGRRFGADKPVYCTTSKWQAPSQTKDDLAAVAQYREERRAFEDLFKEAKLICLVEP